MTTTQKKLRWGILGAGRIAGVFAEGLKDSRHGELVAVASRTEEKANQFAAQYGAPKAYGSYESALADPEIDAFYLATPHPEHIRWGIAILEAGKHLLCEKPLTLNHGEAMSFIHSANRQKRNLTEAVMYRTHPQTRKVVSLVREGAIGQVQLIQSTFSYRAGFSATSRTWNNELGGGGILDVGIYPVSFSRLIAGAALDRPFADPLSVRGHANLHPETGVDARAIGTLQFEGGILAQVSTGVDIHQENSATIYGEKGYLKIPAPWTHLQHGKGDYQITLHVNGQEPETLTIPSERSVYALEADEFAEAIFAGKLETGFMSHQDTLGNLRTLDQWREAVGLTYHKEKPENLSTETFAGRKLTVNTSPSLPKTRIKGLDKPISRLAIGCDNQKTMPPSAAIWDAWFEAGGNVFDTAFIYGGGIMEKLLGEWLRKRGVREQSVLTVKGAHTPNCFPDKLVEQLDISLDRLQTDHADIYMMHRDNTDIPVGEFIDVLNQLKQAGRIHLFGGSNWTLKRIVEANEYARQHQLEGFSVISNNFSLARMVDPVWAGCESANSPEFLELLKQGDLALFPWSSQARGFFTDRASPNKQEDPELVRCWYAEDNFQRRERAIELAAKKGVQPINIALAWVLAQPFPVFPLIGPRTIQEFESSLRAFEVELTAEEVAWLNLEEVKR